MCCVCGGGAARLVTCPRPPPPPPLEPLPPNGPQISSVKKVKFTKQKTEEPPAGGTSFSSHKQNKKTSQMV